MLEFLGRKELLCSGSRTRRGGRTARLTEGLAALEVERGVKFLSPLAASSPRLSEARGTQLGSRGAHFLTLLVLNT